MPTQYNGDSGNIVVPNQVNITSTTNAVPVVVQTSAPHLLTTGDTAVVFGNAVNTGANGVWVVTVIDATHVSLNGSTGTGVGTATGAIVSLALGATYQIPADGDALNAASVNVAFETLGDRTALLSANMGQYRECGLSLTHLDDNATEKLSWLSHTMATSLTWESLGTILQSLVGELLAGDLVEVSFTGTGTFLNSGGASNIACLALGWATYANGGAPGTPGKVSGSGQLLGQSTTGGSAGVNLRGFFQPGGENMALYLMGYTDNPTPADVSFSMIGDWQSSVVIHRPTAFVNRNG